MGTEGPAQNRAMVRQFRSRTEHSQNRSQVKRERGPFRTNGVSIGGEFDGTLSQ